MATPKVRIYELSKVLGVSSKELMDLLEKTYQISVKSHSSSIDQDIAEKLVAQFSSALKSSGEAKPETSALQEASGKAGAAASKSTVKKAPKTTSASAKPSLTPVNPGESHGTAKTGAAQSVRSAQAPASSKDSAPVTSDAPDKQGSSRTATLLASKQQPKRPASPQAEEKAKPISPAVSGKPPEKKNQASGLAQEKVVSLAVKEAPVQAPPEMEDDAVLEILKPAAEEDPYSEIAQTVERQQRSDYAKSSFKKVGTEADKGEKLVQTAPRKEDAPAVQAHPAAAAQRQPVEPAVAEPVVVQIEAPLSIAELAQKLKKRETELIRHLFMKGIMVTVNQTMQIEDAITLTQELGFEARGPEKKSEVDQWTAPEVRVRHAKGKHLKPRAPVVSIMGHVDHGKTSLLDAIRESRHKIVDTEAGGITQSIGAYTVYKDDHKIVFIDTPGHEAFTSMRMRGAQATDIAILVVAADDGVMPQTIEALNHAKAANIPIIVAINKIDKPGADPERVMVQLSEHGLTAEKWGGDTIMVEVSALQKLGLDDLLEMITLVAELQDLKADPTVPAEGVVIEARLDKGKGPVATVLVQNGTLHVGENILLNHVGGRVRALIDDSGERIKLAGPSTPVEILGINDVPQAGDALTVVRNDKEFKRLLQQRVGQEREQRISKVSMPGLVTERETKRKDFYLIVKADTQGSVEAIVSSILQLATEEVSVNVIHAGTGDISEADVLLASASNALIIAFNVKEEANAQRTAQEQGIPIRSYDVIYHVIEDMKKMMLGLLAPEMEEQELGAAEVRELFTFGKTVIAGCYVTEGKIVRNALARVFRNGKEIFKGQLSNLKRFKEDAREVAAGYECGISFDKFNDIQQGDLIRVYVIKEIERTSL